MGKMDVLSLKGFDAHMPGFAVQQSIAMPLWREKNHTK
jgi:hypothetical protein